MGNQNFSTANDPDIKDPRTQQWSVSLDREIGRRSAFRFTYSGRRDTNLTLAPDLNQLQPNTVGFANLPRIGPSLPQLAADQHARQRRRGSSYHDLTFQLRGEAVPASSATRPPTSGPTPARTSRGRAERRSAASTTRSTAAPSTASTPTTRAGPCTSIPDHRVMATVIWELPFAKDNAILGGWTVSGHRELADRHAPHRALHAATAAPAPTASARRRRTRWPARTRTPGPGPPTSGSTRPPSRPRRSSTPRAGRSSPAASATRRTAPSTGPGFFVLDLGLFKDFKLGPTPGCGSRPRPRTSPTTRTTGNPVTDLTSPNYGRITSLAAGHPRQPGRRAGRAVHVLSPAVVGRPAAWIAAAARRSCLSPPGGSWPGAPLAAPPRFPRGERGSTWRPRRATATPASVLDGESILPNGRLLTPTGRQVDDRAPSVRPRAERGRLGPGHGERGRGALFAHGDPRSRAATAREVLQIPAGADTDKRAPAVRLPGRRGGHGARPRLRVRRRQRRWWPSSPSTRATASPPSTSATRSIPGAFTTDLALSPDGRSPLRAGPGPLPAARGRHARREAVGVVAVGRNPLALTLSADGRRAYVANMGTFQYSLRREPATGQDPRGLPFPPFGLPLAGGARGHHGRAGAGCPAWAIRTWTRRTRSS